MLRLERKYLVPNYMMSDLRRRLKPFLRPDIYGKFHNSNGRLPEYVVRSIYFDSKNLDCYIEKKEGVLLRKKFRIRGYGTYKKNCIVVFEIKQKIENKIKKHRAFVHYDNAVNLLNTGNLEKYVLQENGYANSVNDARRFLFHFKKNHFRPTCLVVYEREAYHGKFDSGIRVTFDKNIRSLSYPELHKLYNDENFSYLFNNHFILEIKYFNNTMPLWARSIVQEFKLKNEALSKYIIGFDACKNNKFKIN